MGMISRIDADGKSVNRYCCGRKIGDSLCLRGLAVYRAMDARILLLLLFTIYDIL